MFINSEKENIWSFDSRGELLLTIMSSLAQEESRSISENTKWGNRRRFAEGRFSLAYSCFLGYDRGTEGELVVNPNEAQVVRWIYERFLEGRTPIAIADELTARQVPTPAGGLRWYSTTVQSILQNEKYRGDALLQKSFTVDYLTKRVKRNEGEVPQYYVENDHEAIIDPETFDLTQMELLRRRRLPNIRRRMDIFSGMVQCGECGGWYGKKVWHSRSSYRKAVYRCNQKYQEGKKRCSTPNLVRQDLELLFVQGLTRLCQQREEILAQIERELPGLMAEQTARDLRVPLKEQERMLELRARRIELVRFAEQLSQLSQPIETFSEELWCKMVQKMVVEESREVTLIWRGGLVTKLTLPIPAK